MRERFDSTVHNTVFLLDYRPWPFCRVCEIDGQKDGLAIYCCSTVLFDGPFVPSFPQIIHSPSSSSCSSLDGCTIKLLSLLVPTIPPPANSQSPADNNGGWDAGLFKCAQKHKSTHFLMKDPVPFPPFPELVGKLFFHEREMQGGERPYGGWIKNAPTSP